MSGFKDENRIDDLRRRLYDRGQTPKETGRHELTDEKQAVKTNWDITPTNRPEPAPEPIPEPAPIPEPTPEPEPVVMETPEPTESFTDESQEAIVTETEPIMAKVKRRYRTILIAISLLVLVVVIGFSSAFLFLGSNSISPRNVDIAINGPFAVGGGDVLSMQIGITNQNVAPIESATLIMKYPPGTRSVGENERDLFEERLPLKDIQAGETLNVPVQVAVFGEENDEKSISATVEYRLSNSNGTFFKDAEPFTFKINSAPVSVSVDSVKKVASGQETDITLTVRSNSPNPINDILVSADYPSSFDYSSADPEPFYGQNTWVFDSLQPEEEKTITIKGAILGQQDDEFVMRFTVGRPNENNQFQMGSVLATGQAEFLVERPFVGIKVAVNGDSDGSVVLEPNKPATVRVEITNTLEDSIYDLSVDAALVGTAVRENDVVVQKGFYDSVNNVVRWNRSSDPSFDSIKPGQTKILSFDFEPLPQDNTPTFDIKVDAHARRVSESSASEELIGSAVTNARISTKLAVDRMVDRNSSVFADSGPVPPVAEQATTYTITLTTQNGSNDVLDAVVTTSIPQFVNWLDKVSGDGDVTYNPISKSIEWDAGSIDANKVRTVSFQVQLVPSLSQIGTTPAILGETRLKATDRFTGSVVRADAPPASAELDESQYGRHSGEVQDPADVEEDN